MFLERDLENGEVTEKSFEVKLLELAMADKWEFIIRDVDDILYLIGIFDDKKMITSVPYFCHTKDLNLKSLEDYDNLYDCLVRAGDPPVIISELYNSVKKLERKATEYGDAQALSLLGYNYAVLDTPNSCYWAYKNQWGSNDYVHLKIPT